MKRFVALAGILLSVSELRAVSAETWSASTPEQLAHGTLDGTALDADGRVRLAPRIETLWGPGEGIVWAVEAAGPRAGFVALSGPGRLLRVEAGQQPERWFEAAAESLVTALAADGEGGVYFGLSPQGRVMRAHKLAAGPVLSDLVLETGAKFVWSLGRGAAGTLWIATGTPGTLLRRRPDGEVDTVFVAGDDPVRSLAVVPSGGVVVGTGGRGRVIRIDPEDRAFVLFDADETEIAALAVGADGTIFALAAQKGRQPSAARASASPEGAELGGGPRLVPAAPTEATSGEESPEPEPPPRPSARPAPAGLPGGALYRIDPDGSVQRLWSASDEIAFSMVLDRDGRLLVGTGDQGRIHEIDRSGRAARLLRVSSDQTSALGRGGAAGSVLVGGTTDARVEILGPELRDEGIYLSPVVDAGTLADWGRVRWDVERPGGASIRVEVRSGNTAEPDATWAPWRRLRTDNGVEGEVGELPPARWFQSRFTLSARGQESARLRRIEVAYQPRNRAPVFQSLGVEPAGVAWSKGPAPSGTTSGPVAADDPVARGIAAGLQPSRVGPPLLRRLYEAGVRTFQWRCDDPDKDRLRYRVEVRREGEETWFVLASALEDEYLSWDARAATDGVYRARVTADDAADNANGSHRTAERVSDAFRVDNRRPTVAELRVERGDDAWEVRFVARDEAGAVTALEVALDGGEWIPLSPLDGVADAEVESYRLVLPRAARGATAPTLVVRAVDAAGNVGGAMWNLAP